MNKVTFPLKLQMNRAEVANLQAALSVLGSTIAEAENTHQRYGASTRAAAKRPQPREYRRAPAYKLTMTTPLRGCDTTRRDRRPATQAIVSVSPAALLGAGVTTTGREQT